MWLVENTRIHLKRGDITDFEGDAIVNAANTKLLLGGGVAGAIRKKGGPSIQRECNEIGPVKLGEAAITSSGNLHSKFVIHAASMHLGGKTTSESLRNTVLSSLRIGAVNKIKSIAFPAIGTGIAGFPIADCAKIMCEAFELFIKTEQHHLQEIYVILFTETDLQKFEHIFHEILNN
jgi:O-acetyl-ADP-ribose deacetylase (regulator of RNase III)